MMNELIACPNCQAENPARAQTCRNCGFRLAADKDDTRPDLPPVRVESRGEKTLIEQGDLRARLHPSLTLTSGHFTHVGRARKVNQDSLLVMEADRVNLSIPSPLGLYVVADGMGGHAAGEVASNIVVSVLARHAQADLFTHFVESELAESDVQSWIKSAVESANRAILEKRAANQTDMGSTLVMIVAKGQWAHVAHVGDSRAYRLTADGELERLTADHSLVEQLLLSKRITPEEAQVHPQRNVIYRTMGEKEEIELDMRTLELVPGDRFILCCDGLNSMIGDDRIAAIVRSSASPSEAARCLVAAANEAGGQDNITAIVVEAVPL